MSQTPESTTPTAPAAGLLKASEAAATVDLSESDATVNNAAGLSREALELEVSQVLGTFNSWWGGVKKQVGRYPTLADTVCLCHLHHSSRSGQDGQASAD